MASSPASPPHRLELPFTFDSPAFVPGAALGASKRCGRCGGTKSVTEFYRDKTKRDGLRSLCRYCEGYRAVNFSTAPSVTQSTSWVALSLRDVCRAVPARCGVYAIGVDGAIVYIGQSKNLRTRLLTHGNLKRHKIPTERVSVVFKECADHVMQEALLILEVRPAWNAAFPSGRPLPSVRPAATDQNTVTCSACQQSKPIADFNRAKDGERRSCHVCDSSRALTNYQARVGHASTQTTTRTFRAPKPFLDYSYQTARRIYKDGETWERAVLLARARTVAWHRQPVESLPDPGIDSTLLGGA